MASIAAIVPAAGLSSRMGGPNKLLLPWGNSTVVESVVRILVKCSLDVVVVTGRDAEEVAAAVAPASAVYNDRHAEGLGTSIASGVAAKPSASGYLIALGDMPGLSEAAIRTLISEFAGAEQDAILAPVYESEPGRPGHPVLFGPAYRPALAALTGDVGARSILEANKAKLRLIPVPGGLSDIDQPGDL